MDVKADLIGLDRGTYERIRARLDGLDDDEYLWEPAPGCWTVREWPDGRWHMDWAPMPDAPPPLTTIAWRLHHLFLDVYGGQRNAAMLGLPDETDPTHVDVVEPSAAAALARLDAAHDHWAELLAAVTTEQLAEKLGPAGGQYADADRAGFALHALDEAIHHGAEIAVLRDVHAALHRPGDGPPTVARSAANARWDDAIALVEAGEPVDGVHNGLTALHHASAAGRIDLVRLLVDHGADTGATDAQWQSRPHQWARQFGRTDVVDYLKAVR